MLYEKQKTHREEKIIENRAHLLIRFEHAPLYTIYMKITTKTA